MSRPPQSTTTPSQSNTTTTTTVENEPVVLRLRQDENIATDLTLGTKSKKKKSKLKKKPRVRWTEDVVDNEHMDKKKSKICCIFHPQREFGEESNSSSDSSAESSSDSDSDKEDYRHGQRHDHSNCNHIKKAPRSSSPNAYEKQPNYRKKDEAK